MKFWTHMVAAGVLVAMAAAPARGQGTAPLTIEMQPLGTLGGGSARGLAINEAGEVVGASFTADGLTQGFLWTSSSGMVAIPPFPDDVTSVAWQINSAGQVFGVSGRAFEEDQPERLLIWTGGVAADGGSMGRFMVLRDANDSGHVVGYSYTFSLDTARCIYWSPERQLQEIVPFAGAKECELISVNASGQAVGVAYAPTSTFDQARAFLYDYHTQTSTLLAPPFEAPYHSIAQGINDLGHVVVIIGQSIDPGPWEYRTYLWTAPGTLVDIGWPAGSTTIIGYAINNLDHIVGGFLRGDDPVAAFRWTAGDGITELPRLNTGDHLAHVVNDRGQVGGHTTEFIDGGSISSAFLWTEEAGMLSLNVPGAQSSLLSGIAGQGMNNAGDVVGNAILADGSVQAVVWHVRTRPPTPQEAIDAIGDQIETLTNSATLGEGEANALQAKLDAALNRLDKGKPKEAANALNAFINQVEAMVKSGRLSAAEGEALIAAARAIIGQMQG